MKRDLIISVSFANLSFLSAWSHVLSPGSGYYRPITREILVVLCSVVLTALLVWALIYLARQRGSSRALKLTKIFLACVAIDSLLSSVVSGKVGILTQLFLLTGFCIAMFTLASLRFRVATLCLLCCSPFVLITFGEAAWVLAKSQSSKAQVKLPSNVPRRDGRVLWIVFDELDENVAFVARPQAIHLPEFDRLKAESWQATSAYPPANYTELSIPALMTGRIVTNSKPIDANELSLNVLGVEGELPWSKQPSVLSDVKLLGYKTALVGWYHPYCDVLGNQLDYCVQVKCADALDIPARTVGAEIKRTFPVTTLLFPDHPLANERQRRIQEYEKIRSAAIVALNGFDSGLLVLHLPIPHPPAIYDRRFSRLSSGDDDSYLDDLVLADRTLGELRAVVEKRGKWDDTTVLVTSDHWWRVRFWSKHSKWTQEENAFVAKVDHRVPFMLKLPHQSKSSAYDAPFNTVITRELLVSALKGEIKSAAELSSKVDGLRRQSQGFAPFYRDYDTQIGHLSSASN